jgi:hypothetical protein
MGGDLVRGTGGSKAWKRGRRKGNGPKKEDPKGGEKGKIGRKTQKIFTSQKFAVQQLTTPGIRRPKKLLKNPWRTARMGLELSRR